MKILVVNSILIHKDYAPEKPYDIALLRLETALPIDRESAPICLPGGPKFPGVISYSE